jgi:hypothetical protein
METIASDSEAVVRFTDDSADTRNTELQEGCVTGLSEMAKGLVTEAFDAQRDFADVGGATMYDDTICAPLAKRGEETERALLEYIASLEARVRAQEELIAQLELDKASLAGKIRDCFDFVKANMPRTPEHEESE